MKKRIIVFTMMILCLFTCLSACTKKQEEEEVKPLYDLGGKTYYNTVDNYGHEDHSKLWLGKDGSFVLNDSYADGVKDISGKWTLNEDVLTLEADDGKKIILEVKDIDTLTLKTSLDGSKSDETFSTTEIKGSTANVTPTDDKKEEQPKEDTPKDVPCTGITSLYHNYWSYEGARDWDLEIRPIPADTTDKMHFKSNDESVVKIDEQGRATAVGVGKTTIDVTCGNQKLTVNYEVRDKSAGSASTWVCYNPNAIEGCEPTVYFDGKGNFEMTENGFSGMGTYKGTYKIEDGRYYCTVTSIKAERCYLPEVEEIVFKIVDDKTLKLKTGLQMSQSGDLFVLAS